MLVGVSTSVSCMSNGEGVAQNLAKVGGALSASLRRRRCCWVQDTSVSCMRHGEGVAQNLAKAAALYQQACDAGDAVGCVNLGGLAFERQGVAQDLAKAVALYQQACDAGDASGCFNTGVLHQNVRVLLRTWRGRQRSINEPVTPAMLVDVTTSVSCMRMVRVLLKTWRSRQRSISEPAMLA